MSSRFLLTDLIRENEDEEEGGDDNRYGDLRKDVSINLENMFCLNLSCFASFWCNAIRCQ